MCMFKAEDVYVKVRFGVFFLVAFPPFPQFKVSQPNV